MPNYGIHMQYVSIRSAIYSELFLSLKVPGRIFILSFFLQIIQKKPSLEDF